MNALTLTATRRRKTLVNLNGSARGAKYVTLLIARNLFGEKASIAATAICVCAVWWHAISAADMVAAGESIATDCLYAAPWALVSAARFINSFMKKGGAE